MQNLKIYEGNMKLLINKVEVTLEERCITVDINNVWKRYLYFSISLYFDDHKM